MDATQSNRLSRALAAASQSLSQDVQLRMQMAQQAFKERVMQAQAQQRGEDAKAAAAQRAQTEADRVAENQQRHEDRQQAEADRVQQNQAMNAMRQQAESDANANRQESNAIRLQGLQMEHDIQQQRVDDAKAKLAEGKSAHNTAEITAQDDYLKQANAALASLGKQIGSLQAQAKALDSAVAMDPSAKAAAQSKLDAQIAVATANQRSVTNSLTTGLQKFGAQHGMTSPAPASAATAPMPSGPLAGSPRTVTAYKGKFYPSNSPNLPAGLKRTMLPVGTRANPNAEDGTTITLPGQQLQLPGQQPMPSLQPDTGGGD